MCNVRTVSNNKTTIYRFDRIFGVRFIYLPSSEHLPCIIR